MNESLYKVLCCSKLSLHFAMFKKFNQRLQLAWKPSVAVDRSQVLKKQIQSLPLSSFQI